MENMIDLLMKADAGKLTENNTKKYEVKRLSKVLGTKFELTIQAIPAKEYTEIQRLAIDKQGEADYFKAQIGVLMAGIVDPDIRNKGLLSKFGVITPKEFINKLFLAGEITAIASEITKLSGYNTDQDKVTDEVKN